MRISPSLGKLMESWRLQGLVNWRFLQARITISAVIKNQYFKLRLNLRISNLYGESETTTRLLLLTWDYWFSQISLIELDIKCTQILFCITAESICFTILFICNYLGIAAIKNKVFLIKNSHNPPISLQTPYLLVPWLAVYMVGIISCYIASFMWVETAFLCPSHLAPQAPADHLLRGQRLRGPSCPGRHGAGVSSPLVFHQEHL